MSTPSEPDQRGPLVAQDVLRLDLTQRPTREEAGFAEGRNSVVFERVGDAIDVELVLPGGPLRLDAFGVALTGPMGEPAGGDVSRVVVNQRLPGLAAVRDELVAHAQVLGLDAGAVEQWAAQAGAARTPRVFEAVTGEPGVSAEARPSSGDDSWTVDYAFTFDGASPAG